MTLLGSLLAAAHAESITLSVSPFVASPSPLRDEHVWLGHVSTLAGQPVVGRRYRTEGGAHFVIPMVARAAVRDDAPARARPVRRPQAAIASRTVEPQVGVFRPGRIVASEAGPQSVEIQIATAGHGTFDGRVRVAVGRGTAWATPDSGEPVSVVQTPLAHGGPVLLVPHEVSFWVPDTAWGHQRETLVYTAAPW